MKSTGLAGTSTHANSAPSSVAEPVAGRSSPARATYCQPAGISTSTPKADTPPVYSTDMAMVTFAPAMYPPELWVTVRVSSPPGDSLTVRGVSGLKTCSSASPKRYFTSDETCWSPEAVAGTPKVYVKSTVLAGMSIQENSTPSVTFCMLAGGSFPPVVRHSQPAGRVTSMPRAMRLPLYGISTPTTRLVPATYSPALWVMLRDTGEMAITSGVTFVISSSASQRYSISALISCSPAAYAGGLTV